MPVLGLRSVGFKEEEYICGSSQSSFRCWDSSLCIGLENVLLNLNLEKERNRSGAAEWLCRDMQKPHEEEEDPAQWRRRSHHDKLQHRCTCPHVTSTPQKHVTEGKGDGGAQCPQTHKHSWDIQGPHASLLVSSARLCPYLPPPHICLCISQQPSSVGKLYVC